MKARLLTSLLSILSLSGCAFDRVKAPDGATTYSRRAYMAGYPGVKSVTIRPEIPSTLSGPAARSTSSGPAVPAAQGHSGPARVRPDTDRAVRSFGRLRTFGSRRAVRDVYSETALQNVKYSGGLCPWAPRSPKRERMRKFRQLSSKNRAYPFGNSGNPSASSEPAALPGSGAVYARPHLGFPPSAR
jgi:hypothetical protein